MMLDADVVAVSPASVWRVLQQAGLLWRWKGKPSGKGTGFEQPPQPHQHWHIDVSYINVSGTFYYLCSILDGYSRSIVHWDLRESMTEAEIEVILQRAREKRSEEHTSELQSRLHLVCRLLLEKKNNRRVVVLRHAALRSATDLLIVLRA